MCSISLQKRPVLTSLFYADDLLQVMFGLPVIIGSLDTAMAEMLLG